MKNYFWRILVSFLLLIFLLRWIRLDELTGMLQNLSYPYLLAYIGISLADRWVMAYKWNFLLEAKAIRVSLKELTIIYFKGTFIGGLLPSSIGGDAVRVYEIIKQNGALFDEALSSVIMERFLGFLSAALLALLMLPLVYWWTPQFPAAILWLLALLLAGGLLFLLVFIRGTRPRRLNRFFERFFLTRKLIGLADSLLRYQDRPEVLFRFLAWSFAEQLLPVAALLFLSRALGLSIPLHSFLPMIPITQFFARIPISLSGFGLQEGVFMSFFSLIQLSPTSSFLLGLASNLGNVLTSLPGAYYYLAGPTREKVVSLNPGSVNRDDDHD